MSDAGGGPNYVKSGWDYRVLSEMRYTLATRLPVKDTLTGNQIIERISNSIINAALVKPLEFWYDNDNTLLVQAILKDERYPFMQNALSILYIRFPFEKSFTILHILTEQKLKNLTVLPDLISSLSLLENPLNLSLDEKHFLQPLLDQNLSLDNLANYLKASYAEACLVQAENYLKKNDT